MVTRGLGKIDIYSFIIAIVIKKEKKKKKTWSDPIVRCFSTRLTPTGLSRSQKVGHVEVLLIQQTSHMKSC